MQFFDHKKIDLYKFHLNDPKFDHNYNIFISELFDNDNNLINIKSSSLRLLNVKNNILNTELLYSSTEFYEFINKLDEHVKNEIIKNGSRWFGNNLNTDTINNMFKRSVFLPDRLPGFPTFIFEINDETKIINKRKKISIDNLHNNMELEISFIINGVYFFKNKCNLIYTTKEIKVINDMCQTIESLFEDSDNEECSPNNTESEINDVISSTFE
jgi:hypothetical protein